MHNFLRRLPNLRLILVVFVVALQLHTQVQGLGGLADMFVKYWVRTTTTTTTSQVLPFFRVTFAEDPSG